MNFCWKNSHGDEDNEIKTVQMCYTLFMLLSS